MVEQIKSEDNLYPQSLRVIICAAFVLSTHAWAQQSDSCAGMINFKASNVEITKAAEVAAGTTVPNLFGPGHSAPQPAYCRVEGLINRRTGAGGEEFGITFALAMPDRWNGDFLMQGGGGSNGVVLPPLGLNAAGDQPGLIRGFQLAAFPVHVQVSIAVRRTVFAAVGVN